MSITVKKNVPSGTIVLNRPEKRNALTRQMIADLSQAFTDLHGEKQVRAVILIGNGPVFCAGMDLGEMQQTAALPNAQERNRELAFRAANGGLNEEERAEYLGLIARK